MKILKSLFLQDNPTFDVANDVEVIIDDVDQKEIDQLPIGDFEVSEEEAKYGLTLVPDEPSDHVADNFCDKREEGLRSALKALKLTYIDKFNEEVFVNALIEATHDTEVVKAVNEMVKVGSLYGVTATTLHKTLKECGFYTASYSNFNAQLKKIHNQKGK